MSRNAKLSIALVVVVVLTIVGVALFTGGSDDTTTAVAESSESDGTAPTGPDAASVDERLVRDDSPRLTTGTEAEFVEFLDFECEACGAFYPTIMEMKERYGDRVSFVVRYLPLHNSSVNAATAAEAAGQQGKYQEMYDILFQRQTEWAEQPTAERDKFFTYAEEIGLDMAQFATDFEDPAILARIEQSQADAEALGIQGTPTLFMDGKQFQPESLDELVATFDDAIAN